MFLKRRSIAPARFAALAALPAILICTLAAPLHAAAPAFKADGPIASDTGYTLVEWANDGPVSLDISRHADLKDSRTLYSGSNSAYFISGLADGTYYLGLRDGSGTEAATLRMTVTHQSLTHALWLAGLGALVFLSVVAVIFRGARDE